MPALYLTHRARHVRLEDGGIVVDSVDDDGAERSDRLLLKDVDRVVVAGSPHITIPSLKSFCRAGVPLALISEKGRWLGELSGACDKNAARRLAQYRCALEGEPAALRFARPAIAAKIANQRHVLRRLASRSRGKNGCAPTLSRLKKLLALAANAESLSELRGFEGIASAEYFGALAPFFPEETPFLGRSRRPPRDAGNALLSFTYAILLSEVESAVRAHGLDPALGFLHATVPGRPSLALDLLEPLRPSADAFALSLLNKKILGKKDFRLSEDDGGTYLKQESHAVFFEHYEKSMTRRFAFGDDGGRLSLRRVPETQTLSVLRTLEDPTEKPEFFRIPE